MPEHELWTFEVTGPQPLSMQIIGNPSLVHSPPMSITALLLTPRQAEVVENAIRARGFSVNKRVAARQTIEQHEERLAILGSEDTVFPCADCPICFFFDPLLPDSKICGRTYWPAAMVEGALDTHPEARAAEYACPVKPWTSL